MTLNATVVRAVMRQLQELETSPVDGVTLRATDDIASIEADLRGPEDTPFASGSFHVSLVLGEQYPEAPPRGYFRTKIFHPNVSVDKGEICVNTLKKDWSPTLGLRHVLTVIRCLLIEPNAESALNEEAGRLLLEDYQSFERKARMWTNVHAVSAAGAAATATSLTATAAAAAVAATATSSSAAGAAALRTVEGNAMNASAVAGTAGAGAATSSVVNATAMADKKAAEKKKAALKRL